MSVTGTTGVVDVPELLVESVVDVSEELELDVDVVVLLLLFEEVVTFCARLRGVVVLGLVAVALVEALAFEEEEVVVGLVVEALKIWLELEPRIIEEGGVLLDAADELEETTKLLALRGKMRCKSRGATVVLAFRSSSCDLCGSWTTAYSRSPIKARVTASNDSSGTKRSIGGL